jgi:hypothetical protein
MCGLDGGANILDVARIDDEDLAALAGRQSSERGFDGLDRMYPRLPTERLPELEEKIVVRGDRSNVCSRLGDWWGARAARRCALCAGGRSCTGHCVVISN